MEITTTNKEIQWGEPRELSAFEMPILPLGAFPSPFKEYINAVAAYTYTWQDMGAAACLGAVATAVSGKINMRLSSGFEFPTTLYIIIVAKPAERKSSVFSSFTNIIYQYEDKKNRELRPAIVEYNIKKEQLEKDIIGAKKSGLIPDALLLQTELERLEDEPVKPIRLIAGDVTPEQLTSLLANNNGKMAIFSDEGGIFKTFAGRYNANIANIDTVLKGHDGGLIRVDRQGRESEKINNACLTMVLAMQESVIYELLSNSEFVGRGLIARMLFCKPRSWIGKRVYNTPPIPDDIKAAYEKAIWTMLDLPKATLTLSPEADKYAERWFNKLEPMHNEELASMSDWSGKAHNTMLRIAGLLHCMEHYEAIAEGRRLIISENTLVGAIEYAEYYLEYAKWAYGIMGADKRIVDAQYVLAKLREHGITEGNSIDILKVCRRFKRVENIVPILQLLEGYGYLASFETEWSGIGRKPEPKYKVNPNVLT